MSPKLPALDPATPCPRCGRTGVLYQDPAFNKLSRFRAGVAICGPCGIEEALAGDRPRWGHDASEGPAVP